MLTLLASSCQDLSAKSLVRIEQKPSIVDRMLCQDWFRRLIPRTTYRERTSTRLMHDLPAGLPPPSANWGGSEFAKDSFFSPTKEHFRSDVEFYQFIDLTNKIGYTPYELSKFLRVSGYHRGVEMILAEVKKSTDYPAIKSRLTELSEHTDIIGIGGRLHQLTFRDTPTVSIYRGTYLPTSELKRLFKMDWETYSESYLPGKAAGDWGRGSYFSIDAAVGQHFATKYHPPIPGNEKWYKLMVEAKVPRERLNKDSANSRWAHDEFQYDPTSLRPEEIENFILFFDGDRSVKIPGEFLRKREFSKIREILSLTNLPELRIRQVIKELE